MNEITSADQLCYEVWVIYPHQNTLAASYWDVMDAWRVAAAITKTEKSATEVTITVANGMQVWVPTGERGKRTDVI